MCGDGWKHLTHRCPSPYITVWTVESKLVGLCENNVTIAINNKCIGDDTKAAARQSLNCIKNKKKLEINMHHLREAMLYRQAP